MKGEMNGGVCVMITSISDSIGCLYRLAHAAKLRRCFLIAVLRRGCSISSIMPKANIARW
jgi:hypothetical protein